jgi:hypothetical protein
LYRIKVARQVARLSALNFVGQQAVSASRSTLQVVVAGANNRRAESQTQPGNLAMRRAGERWEA